MRGVVAVVAVATLGVVAACSSSNDQITNPNSCANLSGNFTATSFTVRGAQDTTLTTNFLSNGGAFTLAFTNGTFTSSFVSQTGATPMTEAGTVTTSGNTITLGNTTLFTGGMSGAQTFTCSANGNTLTLTNTNATFLFPGQTTAQPARFSIVFTRTS